jgi:hypothetical protein
MLAMSAKARKLDRYDVLPSPMNNGKSERVVASLQAWRRVAVLQDHEQWRTFHQRGVLDALIKSRTAYDQVAVAGTVAALDTCIGHIPSFGRT